MRPKDTESHFRTSGEDEVIVDRRAAVEAVFEHPSFIVPALEPNDSAIGRFRESVSRFANGAAHARRRRIAETLIAGLDQDALSAAASFRTSAILDEAADGWIDVMATLARRVPLEVLCLAMGVDESRLEDAKSAIVSVGAAYPPGASSVSEAAVEEAIRVLSLTFGGTGEVVANRVAILVQACDATAGLIGNALNIALRLPRMVLERVSVEELINESLRYSPPVHTTKREATEPITVEGQAFEPGAIAILDLAAASRDPAVEPDPHRFDPFRPSQPPLTFGYGPRSCPGSIYAVVIAGAVIAAVLDRCELAAPSCVYESWPNLMIPAHLRVVAKAVPSAR